MPFTDLIQDYKMLVFDISFLDDETIRAFKSDFGIVAKFFKNKRLGLVDDVYFYSRTGRSGRKNGIDQR